MITELIEGFHKSSSYHILIFHFIGATSFLWLKVRDLNFEVAQLIHIILLCDASFSSLPVPCVCLKLDIGSLFNFFHILVIFWHNFIAVQ